jgi:tRNA(Ile2) C34 agmatinyltransferase TiaS
MPAVATAASGVPVDEQAREIRLFDAGGRTLEDLILERWDELVASGRAECPVCGGHLRAAGGCEGCGSELA